MFTNITIRSMDGGLANCCKTPSSRISELELRRLGPRAFNANDEFIKRKNSMILMDEMPADACRTCISNHPNNHFRMHNEWIGPHQPDPAGLLGADNLHTFEIYMSRACDLACVYCNPNFSTTWAKECGDVTDDAVSGSWQVTMMEAFSEYCRSRDWTKLDRRARFVFLGGEPTYAPETLDMIRLVMDGVPHDKIQFDLVTNLNTKPRVFDRYVDLINGSSMVRWQVSPSIDDVGDRCEAIRYGLDWDRMLTNLDRLKQLDNVDLCLGPTMSIFNIANMRGFIEFFCDRMRDRRCGFSIALGMVYNDLSIACLDKSFVKHLDEAISYLDGIRPRMDHLATALEHAKHMLGTKADEVSISRMLNKLRYFSEKRPNTDYRCLFPHLEGFYRMIDAEPTKGIDS